MKDTTDGFKISEIDLEIRGPGDFMGTRQSGIPEFRLANIVEDQDILKMARETAFELVEEDPLLEAEQNQESSSLLTSQWLERLAEFLQQSDAPASLREGEGIRTRPLRF